MSESSEAIDYSAFGHLKGNIKKIGREKPDGRTYSASEKEEAAESLRHHRTKIMVGMEEDAQETEAGAASGVVQAAEDFGHSSEGFHTKTAALKAENQKRIDNAVKPPHSDVPDDMARTGADGKPLEGKDDPNALKLVGEVEEVPLEELKERINNLIGMQPFKDWISDLEEGKGFTELVDLFNLCGEDCSAQEVNGQKKKKKNTTFYHMVLTGNPGTGKSTVAELYCQYLRSAGLMPGAKFYKVSAGDIVSQFIGATARELKKILRQGKDDGTPLILHLDEAYSLTSNAHGEEAVTELVNAMTEEADRIVLVMSGYQGPMMEMLDKNEGMRSRVRVELDCPDYQDQELISILETMLSGQKIIRTIDPASIPTIETVFTAIRDKMGERFGNGRVAEVLLQDMELAQEKRISLKYKNLSREERLAQRDAIIKDMQTYTTEDVQNSAAFRNAFPEQYAQIKSKNVLRPN